MKTSSSTSDQGKQLGGTSPSLGHVKIRTATL
jgi:hypothetical protein